jgi:murein DD-endopeptidase MepM/ murein hydrolase activator NlpD
VGLEAFDSLLSVGHTVTARHDGIVNTFDYGSSSYGKLVVVTGQCEDKEIKSYYAHLSVFQVSDGDEVTIDDVVGLTGATGYSVCTGGVRCALPHIHYEFRNLRMDQPWIPKRIPTGCTSEELCNTQIP